MQRDISLATPVADNGRVIGYLFPVNDEYWLPLDLGGTPLGPPTYKADAESVIKRHVQE